jgi:hypothetical protein
MQNSDHTHCLTPDCVRQPQCRGVCRICYQAAYGLVRSGKTTWDTLEQFGRVLPVYHYAQNAAVCMTPGCDREAFTRGVCGSCYQVARRAINRGESTWAQLEESGLINSSHAGSGRDAFRAALAAATNTDGN